MNPQWRLADPFRARENFSLPTQAAAAPDGGLAVVDSSLARVTRLDGDGFLRWLIRGGSRAPGEFQRAHKIALAPDGRLFLLNLVLDEAGFYVEREEILAFDAEGRFAGAVRRLDTAPEGREGYRIIMRPMSRGLSVDASGRVEWLELEAEGVRRWRAREEPGGWAAEATAYFPLPEAQVAVAAALPLSGGGIVYTHKDGRVLRQEPGGETKTLHDASSSGRRTPDGVPPVPWDLAAESGGGLLVNDLSRREIRRLEAGLADTEAVFSVEELLDRHPDFRADMEGRGVNPAGAHFTGLTADALGNLAVCSENAAFLFPAGSAAAGFRLGFALPAGPRLLAALSWLALAALAAGLALAAHAFCLGALRLELPPVLSRVAGLLAVSILTLAATLPLLAENVLNRQFAVQEERLAQMLETLPRLIDGDALEKLAEPSAYLGDDYRRLRETLRGVFVSGGIDWNRSYYFALYRFRDDRVYAMMYLNDEVGLYHPCSWEDAKAYRDAWEQGKALVKTGRDAYGDWGVGIVPVRDGAGRVAAVLEVGADLRAFGQALRGLLLNSLKDALTLLAAFLLLSIEFLFFFGLVRQLDPARPAPPAPSGGEEPVSPCFLARPLACLFFTALSFPAAFLPLRMQELARAAGYGPPLAPETLASLAISAELFAFGAAVWLAGQWTSRRGALSAVGLGFPLAGLGLILGWASGDPWLFLLANMAVGAGSGFGFLGLRSLPLGEPFPDLASAGYSHFYSGMTAGAYAGLGIGSAVADHAGYGNAYLAAALLLGASWLAYLRLARLLARAGETRALPDPAASGGADRRGYRDFFRGRGVAAFFGLHILPIYALAAYVTYYFPVFAEARGLGVGDIGRLLMIYGLLVIYWGPAGARLFLDRFGPRRVVMAVQVVSCAALILLVLADSLWAAAAALALFGLIDGLSVAGANRLLLSLPTAGRLGAARLVATGETMGKIGETLGPLLFASALGLGGGTGLLVLAVVFLAAAALFGWFGPDNPPAAARGGGAG